MLGTGLSFSAGYVLGAARGYSTLIILLLLGISGGRIRFLRYIPPVVGEENEEQHRIRHGLSSLFV